MKNFSEIVNYIVQAAEYKIEKNLRALFIQGIFAGMFVSMGAIACFNLVAHVTDPGLGIFLGAFIFPAGIIAILLLDSELFTSNCMAILGVYKKSVKLSSFMKMLVTVLFANAFGAFIIASLSTGGGIFNQQMLEAVSEVAIVKTNMPIGQMLISAILCNIMVCSGVMMAYSADTVIGKIMAVWFPIAVFVLSGTEHIVANVFYLMMGLLNGANITMAGILTNFGVVALGNFIGGGIVIASANYYVDEDLNVNKI